MDCFCKECCKQTSWKSGDLFGTITDVIYTIFAKVKKCVNFVTVPLWWLEHCSKVEKMNIRKIYFRDREIQNLEVMKVGARRYKYPYFFTNIFASHEQFQVINGNQEKPSEVYQKVRKSVSNYHLAIKSGVKGFNERSISRLAAECQPHHKRIVKLLSLTKWW